MLFLLTLLISVSATDLGRRLTLQIMYTFRMCLFLSTVVFVIQTNRPILENRTTWDWWGTHPNFPLHRFHLGERKCSLAKSQGIIMSFSPIKNAVFLHLQSFSLEIVISNDCKLSAFLLHSNSVRGCAEASFYNKGPLRSFIRKKKHVQSCFTERLQCHTWVWPGLIMKLWQINNRGTGCRAGSLKYQG